MDVSGDTFKDLVGSSLVVHDAGFELAVTAVESMGRHHTSVLFLGPQQPILDQATYTLTHEGDPPLHVFIVPIGSDAAGTVYEAVFGGEPPG